MAGRERMGHDLRSVDSRSCRSRSTLPVSMVSTATGVDDYDLSGRSWRRRRLAGPARGRLSRVADFDRDAVIGAIRRDQLGQSTYPEFMLDIWHAGVVAYDIDLAARTCTYLGLDPTSTCTSRTTRRHSCRLTTERASGGRQRGPESPH